MALEASTFDTAASRPTAITAGGSADTKGSYTELIASTSAETYMVHVRMTWDAGNNSFIVYLATGAAASETDVASWTFYSNNSASTTGTYFKFPLTIAASTRISAACQSTSASVACRISVWLSDETDSFMTSTQNETIGTSGSQGTTIDAGATINTKGSWTELVSSTSHDYDYLVVFVGPNVEGVIGGNRNFLIDIGTGAAASEVVIKSNLAHHTDAREHGTIAAGFYLNIASGTRIAARSQCDSNDSLDRLCDVAILGCNLTAPAGGGGTTVPQGLHPITSGINA